MQATSISDSVTRVNDWTRLDSSHDFWWLGLDSSHVEKNGDSTQVTYFTECLESSHNQWLESESFLQNLSLWWANTVCLHTNKWAFFALVILNIGANFLFPLSSRAMLPFKVQVSPTITETDLRFCFSIMGQQGTINWHLIVFKCNICKPCSRQSAS